MFVFAEETPLRNSGVSSLQLTLKEISWGKYEFYFATTSSGRRTAVGNEALSVTLINLYFAFLGTTLHRPSRCQYYHSSCNYLQIFDTLIICIIIFNFHRLHLYFYIMLNCSISFVPKVWVNLVANLEMPPYCSGSRQKFWNARIFSLANILSPNSPECWH